MVHGRTGTIGGRSAERPTRSSTGKGRIVKEEVLIQFVISNRRQIIRIKNSTEIFRTLKSNL